MEFRLLGTLEVADGERLLDLGGAKQRRLLASLLLRPNQVVPAERLVEDLWGEGAPAAASATLYTYISNLRRILEPRARAHEHPVLVTQHPGYRLEVAPDELDVTRFEALARRGREASAAADWEKASRILREALGLWRGKALADFAYDAFAQAEAARLEEARIRVIEERITADLALGRHAEVVGELEALVAEHPLREQLWEHLMVGLYRCGRQAEALRAYQRVRRALGDELGIDPSPALRQLEAAILVQDPTLAPPLIPVAARTAEAPVSIPGNLPRPMTSFVGRDQELATLASLLNDHRLVTVSGPGGCGKTRLALELGRRHPALTPDGVWVVELTAVADDSLVVSAVAAALQIPESPERPLLETVTGAVGRRALLLILDNCEARVSACRDVVSLLLQRCPNLRVLATSRQPLGLAGEHVWRLTPLPLEGDAVKLFADRAAAVSPGFAATEHASAVRVICRRLDGLPLPIELAAARLRVLTAEQIADRIDDRFRLLSGRDPDGPPHHRTVRSMIDWSYELLAPAERAVFNRLSAFGGSFGLDAAEVVSSGGTVRKGDVLDVLAELIDKSLVVRRPDEEGEARYQLLDTLREYAAQRLDAAGEDDAVHERHARWFLQLAERAGPALRGRDQETWLRRLDVERDNFRQALAWSIGAARPTLSLKLALGLWWYWVRRSHLNEGRGWLSRVLLAAPDAPAALRAGALAANAYLAWMQYDLEEAEPLVTDAITLSDNAGLQDAKALALAVAGRIAFDCHRTEEAEAYDEQALALYGSLSDPWGEAWTLRHRAAIAARQQQFDDAATLARRSCSIYEQLADSWGVAGSQDVLVFVLHRQGDLSGARALAEDTVSRYREMGERAYLAVALHHLAAVLEDLGEVEEAAKATEQRDALDRELGNLVPAHSQ